MRAPGLTLKELASALDLSHQPVTNAIVAAYISRSMLETRILKTGLTNNQRPRCAIADR